MRPAGSLLRKVGVAMSPEAVTREQLIRRLKRSGAGFVSDAGEPVVQSSLTIFSEELTVFLGYNNQQLMADLCNWYDCPNPWTYETKSQGIDNITNVWVNLIGATTPKLLQTTMPQDAIGGGLTSRIIFVYEPRKGSTVTRPFKTEDEIILETKLLHDLECIYMMNGEYKPTQSFVDKWDAWYGSQDEQQPFTDPRLEGYLTRRGTHVLKLSMVLNASRKNGNLILDGVDFDRAIYELERIEKRMPSVFLGIGKSDIADVTANVMRTIMLQKVTTFDRLLGMHMHDADYDTMKRIVQTLSTVDLKGDGKKFCTYSPLTGKIEYTP
jgi:hypothetical protein